MSNRYVFRFEEDEETFADVPGDGELDTDKSSFLIIDEDEKKMTMSYRSGISIVMKRKIERRVNSFSKSGFQMGGTRIGTGFPLEQINADEELPDILLTHGHTFGRKLTRDDIPSHAEPEPGMEIVPGSAAVKTDVSASVTKFSLKADVPSAMPPKSTPEPTPEAKPEPTPEAKPEPEGGSSISLTANSSETQSSDDSVWALGQFLDQFARQGKICVVSFEEDGKFRLVTLKDKNFSTSESNVDGNYRIDDVNLFEI